MDDIKRLKENVKDIKMLFVDDDLAIRESSGMFLKKFFDDVTICENGEEAYEVFTKTKDFDLVITDIKMPKMDGIELAKKIKEISPKTFIIFLTASEQLNDTDSKLASITLQKPLTFDYIIKTLKKLEHIK